MNAAAGRGGPLSLGRVGRAIGDVWRGSFRAKFILVVGAAVFFDLMLAGGVSIWNMQRLSKETVREIGVGLTESTEQFLQTYVDMTVSQADLLIDRVHSEITMLANGMQTLIDHPDIKDRIGAAIEASPALTSGLVYDEAGGWSQNAAGVPSAVSVWGYLLDEDRNPVPDTVREIRDSRFLDIMGPAIMRTGAPKLQIYYVGPKHASILRATPWSEQAQMFDELYAGHNEGPNFWDFFFPGVYEGWQAWLEDPASRPVDSNIVTTEPYIDAITGTLIVSYFHPLWTADRSDVAGMVAVDITLEQLTSLVESVTLADTGFGFLVMSNGNVMATNEMGERTLGLVASDIDGQGVTGIDRSFRNSTQPAVAALELPTGPDVTIQHMALDQDGEEASYFVVQKRMSSTNLWDGSGIAGEAMTFGVVVSEAEIYRFLTAIQDSIGEATSRILNWQVGALLVSLCVVFFAVYAISGRITSGLRSLAGAARRLEGKDYSVRVEIPTRDEVGKVGVAFNSMAKEIRFHTENLENLVEERTRGLEEANKEILSLNEQLRDENLRLGAELDVAHRIQKMVLPRVAELDDIPQLDIAGYMEPADEVGGDYYDVLRDGSRIKVGIGDVTGHGLESGVLMLMVQSVARALYERGGEYEKGGEDRERFLEVVNRAIYKNIERTNTDKHLSLAFVDYEDNRLSLTGQHEEAIVLRKDGSLARIDTVDLGFPIGLEFDISPFIATRDVAFESGDTLILHTDGVTEAESPGGELFGLDRLCDSVKSNGGGSAVDVVTGIVSDLKAHIGTQKIHDDITLVVVRHK